MEIVRVADRARPSEHGPQTERAAIASILRKVDLPQHMMQTIDEALSDIAKRNGAESTISRILFESAPAPRQDIINFIGNKLLLAFEQKITLFEQEHFLHCNRAGLLPTELLQFARLASSFNPALANHYQAGFMRLYTKIMATATDEELRQNEMNTTLSANWSSYIAIVKRDLLNPLFTAIANKTLSPELESAFKEAMPTLQRFDKQKQHTGITLLQPENILGTDPRTDMSTHPAGIKEAHDRTKALETLKSYFSPSSLLS